MNIALLYCLLLLILVTAIQVQGMFSAKENVSIPTKTNIRLFHHKAGFDKFYFIFMNKLFLAKPYNYNESELIS